MKWQIKISKGKKNGMLCQIAVNTENYPGEECIISHTGLDYWSV